MDFKKAKELFRDKIDINLYVPLSQKLEIDLTYGISEKEKLILVYGDSGNGKTFLMKKVKENIKDKFEVFFISNPYEESDILNDIKKETIKHKVLFIDEAQTLNDESFERLRILADNDNITIVFATHEKEANNLFSKKHFKTRLDYPIHLKPLDLHKTEAFINSKLVNNKLINIASLFHKKNYKLIYKITRGNLREINKLMYKTFDIVDYFYNKTPNKISKVNFDNKYIEMADMDIKGIYA